MSTSGSSVPALVAAFFFGIVVNAAFAALFLHVSSHGSSVFRDGQRLVLTTFLLSAALWAQVDFISIAIDTTAVSACQIGIIFSTLFDQLARFSIEQYLLWAINKGAKSGLQQILLQTLVGIRFVLGGVFVGFSRPDYNPVCVPKSSMLPIAIVVVALDAVLVAALAITAFTSGLVAEVRGGRSDSGRGKAIFLVMIAFATWTATSVTLLLGMDSTSLLLKTLLPAIGLLVLILVVTVCNDPLTIDTTRATRGLGSPGIRNITTGQSISTDASDYPPSRFEDIKRPEVLSISAFERPREAPRPDMPPDPSNFSRPVVMTASVDIPRNTAFMPSLASLAAIVPANAASRRAQGPKSKRSLLDLRGGPAAGRMVISNPILEANGDQNPLNKIATISLEEAARGERERRANDLQRASAWIAKRPAPQPPNMSTEEAVKRSASLRRKEVASVGPQPPMPTASTLEPMPIAMTSSAQLSPGVEELRKRSPRQPPADREVDRYTQARSTFMRDSPVAEVPSPTIPLPSPRQQISQQMSQDQLDEMELREEMDQIDQLQQATFVFDPQQQQETMSQYDIQPAAIALTSASAVPLRPARPETTFPGPKTGVDFSVRRPDIRPSRQLPKSPTTPPTPEQSKPALQRRPTNGLPGNPRAMAVKAIGNEATNAGRQQTVMFMNNIVYNDPVGVQSIIDGANFTTKSNNRESSQSIVHRPRPIPRHLEKDRAIFPAEPSPNLAGHRRSKSGGAIMAGRKSVILHLDAGSPTQLPPLPYPPSKAAPMPYLQKQMDRPSANRPQPNDTKSMTFDEKMMLLFPTPPNGGAESTSARRRSSVPDLPPMPLDYMPIAFSVIEGNPADGSNSRTSQSTARTGRTSAETENILEVDELLPNARYGLDHERQRSVADGVGSSWLPGLTGRMVIEGAGEGAGALNMWTSTESSGNTTGAGAKRASSPVLPPTRGSAMSLSSDARSQDDGTTNWGSVHSPVYAVPIPANRQVARTTYISGDQQRPANHEEAEGATFSVARSDPLLLPATTYNGHPKPVSRARELSPPASQSSLLTSDDDDDDDAHWQRKERIRESQWHRRVGDNNSLSFSERKEKTRSRKMPPPTPLLLGSASSSTKNPVIVKAAQPSPLESPEQALAYIQAQLKKYEEPYLAGSAAEETPTRRLALLDNLEKEMDLQAGHWQEMQHDLRHDSLSSMQTLSPRAESRRQSVISTHHNPVTAAPQKQKTGAAVHIGADRRAARRSRIHSGISAPKSTATGDSAVRNWINNTMSNIGAVGSATPPESDNDEVSVDLRLHRPQHEAIEATAVDVRTTASGPAAEKIRQLPLLWAPSIATKQAIAASTLLWSPSPVTVSQQANVLFAAAIASFQQSSSAKSKSRQAPLSSGPLPIESVALWAKNASFQNAEASHGLWTSALSRQKHHEQQPRPVEELTREESQMQKMQELELEMEAMEADRQYMSASSQKAPRPITQRPPRRSKRVTMLPDIVENPEPLPDKRGTLGIFQFPWGERSDTAKLPARGTPFMAMPGTMASGGGQVNAALEARARELEAAEYSSSFFDDYDDDDDNDDDDDGDYDEADDDEDEGFDEDGSGSDDGFDENTLWEIASLLKTEQIPSKMSLLPPPLPASTGSAIADYMAEMPSDDESDYHQESIIAGLSFGNGNSREETVPRRPDAQLWNSDENKSVLTFSNGKHGHKKAPFVAEPDEETWQTYNTVSQTATLRSKPRKATDSCHLETSQLWNKSTVAVVTKQSIQALPANTRSLWVMAPAASVSAASEKRVVTTTRQQKQQTKQQNLGKMWTPRAPVKAAASKTKLFDKDVAAATKSASAVTRTTDLEPAAVKMPRMPRARQDAPLAKLTSTGLWMPSASSQKPHMWTPMPVPTLRAKGHLFDRDVAAVEKLRRPIRTTAMEPAAVGMVRVVRSLSHLPELRLESSALWTAATADPASPSSSLVRSHKRMSINWIMAKSPRSIPMIADDTILSSNIGARQKTWWESMKAAAGMTATIPTPAAPSVAQIEAEIDSVRMALKTSPTLPPPAKNVVRRPTASSSDWSAALQEAVQASYPVVRRQRTAVPASEWQAALSRAVARSYPFDAARKHPALAGSSLPSAAVDNDASKLHPVYFQSAPQQIKLVSATPTRPSPDQTSPGGDAAYTEHITAMENLALERLRALEGGARGVVLRY